MGISNLLLFMRPVIKPISISKYKGKVLGVDAMCWMHRGAIACATEMMITGRPGNKFIQFVMKMVNLLLDYDIRPVLVFDGKKLPIKAMEDRARRERRENAEKESKRLLQSGVSINQKELRTLMHQAITVTNDMIVRLMEALRQARIEFLVAPYESDAQLAYLCRTGIVDAVITEDSDLLAYGCPRIIFKMNVLGEGQEIDMVDILPSIISNDGGNSNKSLETNLLDTTAENSIFNDDQFTDAYPRFKDSDKPKLKTLDDWVAVGPEPSISTTSAESPSYSLSSSPSESSVKPSLLSPSLSVSKQEKEAATLREQLRRFTPSMFTAMCVLTGCDYTKAVHISGWGIHYAFNIIKRYRSLQSVFRNALTDLKIAKRIKKMFATASNDIFDHPIILNDIPNFEATVPTWKNVVIMHMLAAAVFSYQWVYDPRTNKVVPVSCAEETIQSCNTIDSNNDHDNNNIIEFEAIKFFANKILGPVEKDGLRLFRHVTGFNSEAKAIQFTPGEVTAISSVSSKRKDEWEYIHSFSKDIKNQLNLQKFNKLFGDIANTSFILSPTRESRGGGTGLMERLHIERRVEAERNNKVDTEHNNNDSSTFINNSQEGEVTNDREDRDSKLSISPFSNRAKRKRETSIDNTVTESTGNVTIQFNKQIATLHGFLDKQELHKLPPKRVSLGEAFKSVYKKSPRCTSSVRNNANSGFIDGESNDSTFSNLNYSNKTQSSSSSLPTLLHNYGSDVAADTNISNRSTYGKIDLFAAVKTGCAKNTKQYNSTTKIFF